MILNDKNQVAIVHLFSNPRNVLLNGDKVLYHFEPQRQISLAWVNQEHVGQVLEIRDGCSSCGSKRRLFRLASQQEVDLWTGVK